MNRYHGDIPSRRISMALACLLAVVASTSIPAQELQELQFINQPITDILRAVAQISGRSIIPDETVQGNASFHFAQADLDEALRVFLETYKLHLREEDGIYFVSRISVAYDDISGTVSMNAEDVPVPALVRSLSRSINTTILYDALPNDPITVHVTRVQPDVVLDIVVRKYPDLEIEREESFFYIKRVPLQTQRAAAQTEPTFEISVNGELYSIRGERVRFSDVIDDLFVKVGFEYSLLTNRDIVLERIRHENRPFEEILRLVLEQASADYTRIGELFYIFEIQERDVLKKFKTSVLIPLVYLSVQNLPNLLPTDLVSTRFYKIDPVTNSVILNGSLEEIAPIEEFIRSVDRPFASQRYFRFDLDYLKPAEFTSIIPDDFKHVPIKVIPNTSSFVVLISPERRDELARYIDEVDVPPTTSVVHLKYIDSEQLVANLPPSIDPEDIVETGDPTVVFVKGTEERVQMILEQLDVLDRPMPQLTYHILVIQFSEGNSLNWSIGLDTSLLQNDDTMAFLGNIGQLLSLNFDIVSTFGYLFAIDLNLDMSNNDAHVLADTTLHGLSGQEISFRNTETFRYRELEVDENGDLVPTGVTREISAGLIFGLTGTVSGDGMITMKLNATISKRGTDTSNTSGSLPPTSENIVDTEVRTPAGVPVVIGGLMRQEESTRINKVPILGDIPILGLLFQSRKTSVDNSELVIYVLPHIDPPAAMGSDTEDELDRLYRKFFEVAVRADVADAPVANEQIRRSSNRTRIVLRFARRDHRSHFFLVSATMNDEDTHDAKKGSDIQIDPDGSIYLRAERSGTSEDRVYTLTFKAVDDSVNETPAEVTVTVPHDQR